MFVVPSGKRNIHSILTKIDNGALLSLDEAWILLNINPTDDVKSFSRILELSRRIKSEIFRGKIYPLVPLYVSSICQEHCMYCNFRADNKNKQIERVRLSNEELSIEVEFLAKKGFRVIELVYATDPFITTVDVSDHVKITHRVLSNFGGGMVGINARPYSVKDYKKLKQSGLDFVVLWQETYDEVRYKQLHPGNTEKTDYYYRLKAPDRMAEAGIESIGLGVLSGLADWRKDWCMLINESCELSIATIRRQSQDSDFRNSKVETGRWRIVKRICFYSKRQRVLTGYFYIWSISTNFIAFCKH